MSTADVIRAGCYVPRLGDQVTVRRYISPTTGARTLNSVRSGEVTNVQADRPGGLRIWLDGDPEWIFTGYQFLGAGSDGRSPASLVTEVTPADANLRVQLTPDLALLLDSSQCIVAEVSDGKGKVLRRVTVTNVDAFKAALDELRGEQRRVLDEARQARLGGRAARRRAEGKLTKSEAVEWLTGPRGWQGVRGLAAAAVRDIAAGEESKPALAAGDEGMTYDGTYWVVPVNTDAM